MILKVFRYIRNHLKLWQAGLEKANRRRYSEQHQLTSTTGSNRYPEIFKAATTLVNNATPKILSYGCSTGEECVSLKSHFPESLIIGADINLQNLKKARKNNSMEGIEYLVSSESKLISRGLYDIIFAMSVLCRWEDTKNVDSIENIYPFNKFNESIKLLFSLLKPGGFLVVYNANFLVEDSEVASFLEPIKLDEIKDSGFVHKFNKQNKKISPKHTTVFYRKNA